MKLTRKQATPNFRKIWRTLFSCYLRFEIRPFALTPANFCLNSCEFLMLKEQNVLLFTISFIV